MRKWKFIEQELINLKAPEKLITYSKILNKIELELNVNWEQKEFDYFSNLIKENKLPIYKILLNSIYTDSKCVTCTNDKEFYPLKHYDCKNKLSENYQKNTRRDAEKWNKKLLLGFVLKYQKNPHIFFVIV